MAVVVAAVTVETLIIVFTKWLKVVEFHEVKNNAKHK
jgi:hypothetical protein